MKALLAYVILLSLLLAARVSRAQGCATPTVAAVSCTRPADAQPLPFDSGGNANVSSGTYYYDGSRSLNINLSGGTLYYGSSSTTSNISQSGGTLVYTAGSSAAPGALTNYNQSGGLIQICGNLSLTGNLNAGSFVVTAGGTVRFPNTLRVQGGSQLINNGSATFASDLGINSNAAGGVVNAGTLAVNGTLFLDGPGFVNQGDATVNMLVINGNGAACLASRSRLTTTTFQTNDRANSITVLPTNGPAACVGLTNGNGNGFNAVLTASSNLIVCKTGTVTAAERAKYGAAQVTPNCSGCQAAPLPVVLVSFAAQAPTAPGSPVQLSWRTASEVNHQGFVVERSADGRTFDDRSSLLPGTGGQLLGGAYAWADLQPLPGTSYYRLRILDRDGHAEYSPTAAAHLAAPTEAWAWAYPPDADHLRLDWQALPGTPAAELLTWQLLDVQGRLVRQQSQPASASTTTLDLAALPPGLYWLRVQQGGRRQLLRFGRP